MDLFTCVTQLFCVHLFSVNYPQSHLRSLRISNLYNYLHVVRFRAQPI